jgi:hypothetical protein
MLPTRDDRQRGLLPALWASLRHPQRYIRAFDARQSGHSKGGRIPYGLWICLAGIAVGGSLLYGASLSLALPEWQPGSSALWLAFSAGLSWCLFGPALVLVTRRRVLTCAHACLVTMAYGEAVLAAGACLNLLFHLAPSLARSIAPGPTNLALVGVSNGVMAALLTGQMRALGVLAWKTLLCWLAVLDGCGALFFSLFQRLLQG